MTSRDELEQLEKSDDIASSLYMAGLIGPQEARLLMNHASRDEITKRIVEAQKKKQWLSDLTWATARRVMDQLRDKFLKTVIK